MTDNSKIRMRGHHLFCETISNHEGKSVWSREFCINMARYQARMRSNDDQVIEIVYACGDTCGLCPNNQDGKCRLYDIVPGSNGIDIRVLQQARLQGGSGDHFRRVEEKGRRGVRHGTTRDVRPRVWPQFHTRMCGGVKEALGTMTLAEDV